MKKSGAIKGAVVTTKKRRGAAGEKKKGHRVDAKESRQRNLGVSRTPRQTVDGLVNVSAGGKKQIPFPLSPSSSLTFYPRLASTLDTVQGPLWLAREPPFFPFFFSPTVWMIRPATCQFSGYSRAKGQREAFDRPKLPRVIEGRC